MAGIEIVRRRPVLNALAVVALLGAADVGAFIAASPGVALKNGGRASGSLGGLVVWLLLVGVTGRRTLVSDESPTLTTATLALAALAAAGGVGLAIVHQLAGVGGWRTLGGGVLGVAALGLAIAARHTATD